MKTGPILNVDDYPPRLYARSRVLRGAGFEVVEATCGVEALRLFTEVAPALVVLDTKLPDIDGFEVCRRIKARSMPRTPVLQLSANLVKDEDRARALEGGADAYLAEPIDASVLLATVHALLRTREGEARLVDEARQWQVTFDAIEEGVCLVDAGGRIVRFNRSLPGLLGRSADALAAESWLTLLRASGDPEFELSTILTTGQRCVTEWTFDERWLRLTADPVLDEHGVPTGAVCVVADVTEHRTAEEGRVKLLAAEREARQAAEESAEMLKRLQAITDTALGQASIGGLLGELLARIREELAVDTIVVLLRTPDGKNLAERAALGLDAAPARTAVVPIGRGFAGRIAERREPVIVQDTTGVQFARPTLPEKGVRSLLGVPLLVGGEVIGVVHVGSVEPRRFQSRDVRLLELVADRLVLALDRVRLFEAERAARAEADRATERSAFLAEASTVLAGSLDYATTLATVARLAVPFLADLCVVDVLEEGRLVTVRVAHRDPELEAAARAALLDRSRDLGSHHPVVLALQTGVSQVIPAISDAFLASIVPDPAQLATLRQFDYRSGMAVPLVARGRTLGVISFLRTGPGEGYGHEDQTLAEDLAHRAALAADNARLYSEAQDAERRKDQFLAMLAHELRNPLAPIMTALRVLDRVGSKDPSAVSMRGLVARQTRHLSRLVEDLMDIARIRFGKIAFKQEPVDLGAAVSRSLEALRSAGRSSTHDITLALPAEPLIVEGDAFRLEQVIGNLLDNAVKYSAEGTAIRVAVEREGDTAVVRVRDQGVGMPADLVPRVFDLFTQAETSPDRATGGLGLGLALVRSIVLHHRGSVTASSAGPGCGSEFVVRLPLAIGSAVPILPAASESHGSSRRILVVEDNPDAREALCALLEIAGHVVETAADGEEAVEKALGTSPEVALVDIGLPVLDGYQVAKRVRASAEGRHIYLVALTGYGQPEDRRRALAAGYDAHLVKPVDPDDLARVIATASRVSAA